MQIGIAELKNNIKSGKSDLFVLLDLCNDLLIKYKKEFGLELIISSEIPVASGFSSSSAVLCAILDSFSKLFEIKIPKKDYYYYLIKYQKIIHGGKASGVEIISSAIGGFNYIYNKHNKMIIKPININPINIIIGDSKIKTKTSKTVGDYIPNMIKNRSKIVNNAFNKIEVIVKKMSEYLINNDLKNVGILMTQNHQILQSLGLSINKIDKAVFNAIKAGAYGAKISGKGQGGIMFALCNDTNQDIIVKSIKKAGLIPYKTIIGNKIRK